MASTRIEYIDAAKGLCMLLLVANHVGIHNLWPGDHIVRVLLFFVLSGYFFSVKLSGKEFVAKKVKTILLPFVLWWCISYAIFYLGMMFIPNFSSMTVGNGILDCFTQKAYFNGPLWFLLALFFIQLICYFVERNVKPTIYRICIYTLVGICGFMLGQYEIDLPLDLDVAMTSTPFFVMGIILRRENMLTKFSRTSYSLFAIFVLYLVYIINPIHFSMSLNRFSSSLPEFFGVGMMLCLAYILICKLISEYIPLLSKSLAFVGRQSMYIMCVHHLLYRPIKIATDHFLSEPYCSIIIFVATMAICLFTAPLVEKYMPLLLGKTKVNSSNQSK